MGRYRLGDIIRMTRKSLSITQDQLSEGICSVETLSRVESGKQNPSKDVYELLMERMGRIRERAYSMQSVSDFKVLELIRRYEQC
ncbi:MAG: helix-turn-helix transcriptional regulator, partial [Clostridiales bacterium]|nr:helix-turn-helix transcriptional regulator [Clostridiales bacterium]